MKLAGLYLFLLTAFSPLSAQQDSLYLAHYALPLQIYSPDTDFLKISDNTGNCHFQGIYQLEGGFSQILYLHAETESLYITLGDSLKVFQLNSNLPELIADFRPPPPSWATRLLWLKHDLEKVFPIIALLIIILIKKHKDKKNQSTIDND
jgi:hypothetical protein